MALPTRTIVPWLALLWACWGCSGGTIRYYPATPSAPMESTNGGPLLARVVVDDTPVRAAPHVRSNTIGTLSYGSLRLVYAFVPAASRPAASRHVLVGDPGTPGRVQGWVPAEALLRLDARPEGWALARSSATFLTGPGPEFRRTRANTAEPFLIARYTGHDGYLLLGEPQADPDGDALQILGWSPESECLPWPTNLGAWFDKGTFDRRPRATIFESRAALRAEPAGAGPEAVLYAESESRAPPDFDLVRFPVLHRLEDERGTLHLALPGGSTGWATQRTENAVRQLLLTHLLSRRDVETVAGWWRHITKRAGGDGRDLALAITEVLAAAEPEAPSPGAWVSLASRIEALYRISVRDPVLSEPPSGVDALCSRTPEACRETVASLRRSLAYLEAVLGEYDVTEHQGEVRPHLPHPWSREPRPRRYWWRTPWGSEYAWVPQEYFPGDGTTDR